MHLFPSLGAPLPVLSETRLIELQLPHGPRRFIAICSGQDQLQRPCLYDTSNQSNLQMADAGFSARAKYSLHLRVHDSSRHGTGHHVDTPTYPDHRLSRNSDLLFNSYHTLSCWPCIGCSHVSHFNSGLEHFIHRRLQQRVRSGSYSGVCT